MFTFRNFNLFELLMKGLQAFRYQPIKIKRMRIGAFYIFTPPTFELLMNDL